MQDLTPFLTGLLRELYSPKFIQSLLVEELGEKYLIKFLNNDIKKVMSFREINTWTLFKKEIFEMFETLNLLEKINPTEFENYKGEQKILAYKKHILGEDSSKFSNLIADLVVMTGETHDPVTGKLISSGKKIIADKLIKIYSDWKISRKMKSYKSFWKKLKEKLDKIE